MILVLRIVLKVSKPSIFGANKIKSQVETNRFVTSVHLVLVLLYTILSILYFNVAATDGTNVSNFVDYRVSSVWTFVGGILDMFISCMLWFVLDD